MKDNIERQSKCRIFSPLTFPGDTDEVGLQHELIGFVSLSDTRWKADHF